MKRHYAARSIFFLAFVLICFAAIMNAQEASPAASASEFKLDPTDYSFWTNVKSPEQFAQWREKVLMFYHRTMRIKPDYQALPLDTKYLETLKINDNLTRYKIDYATTDKLRIPAFLFVPKTDRPVPVVIVYHGHGPGKISAAEGVGTNENALAKYIAEKLGYVVLAPDARSFGEFKIPKSASHYDYFFRLILEKKLYMSKLMEDGYQDLALLRSIPQADMSKLGVAGISMGSWRTLNFAVLHEEAKAAVVTGLYIPWEYLFSPRHCQCQHIPKLAEKMNMEDLAATVFPRDLMIQWGQSDAYYAMDAEKLIDRTGKIASFIGYSDHFIVDRHKNVGHQFSNPEVAGFFRTRFGDGAWPLMDEK
jgi:hypothetical protein